MVSRARLIRGEVRNLGDVREGCVRGRWWFGVGGLLVLGDAHEPVLRAGAVDGPPATVLLCAVVLAVHSRDDAEITVAGAGSPRGRGARFGPLLRELHALRFHRVVGSRDRHDVQEHHDQVAPVRDDVLGPAHALFRVESRVGRVRHLREDDEGVTAELADHLARRGETVSVRMLFGFVRVDVRRGRVDIAVRAR